MKRSRPWYSLAVVGVIALGLGSRRLGSFTDVLGNHPGDVLWTLMVYLGWGLLFPKWPVWKIGLLALVTSYGVEFAKLNHTPWLENFRNTTFGRLVLGYAFSWGNLVAYTIGACIGVAVEWWLSRQRLTSVPIVSSD